MPIERKLAAIMFTDIAGYTAQMSKDEAVAISLLNKKESVLKPLIAKHNGTYVKSTGDGSLSYFNSAVDAAMCAKRFQESIYDDKDLNVRVGVHLGETIFEKGDIQGDGVNIASRLESMAVEGGVFVSKEVHDQLTNQKEFEGISLGLQKMNGVGRLIEVYGLKGDKLNEPNPKDYKKTCCPRCDSENEVPSIAIIPFRNKGKKKDEFFAYGVYSELISDVSSAGLIRVASKKQIEDVGDLPQDELAKKLNVRYIANGELWKMDDMFQLSIELYDSKEKRVIWSDNWEENWENLPRIKGSLSNEILKVLNTQPKLEKKVDTSDTQAYEYYLKGKYRFMKRENMEDTDIARGLMRKAIGLDDNLIIAKLLLGWTYFMMGNYDKAMDIYNPALKQAEELGDKYLIGHCFSNIGNTYFHKGDLDKALDYQTRTINIKEELGYKKEALLVNIGNIFYRKGDLDKALECYTSDLKKLDKHSSMNILRVILTNISNVYQDKGDFDKALEYKTRAHNIAEKIGTKSEIGYSLSDIGIVCYYRGDYNKAVELLKDSFSILKDITGADDLILYATYLCLAYKALGKEFDKNKIYKLIQEAEDIKFVIYYRLYELLDDSSYLETAYNQIQEKADNLEPDVAAKFLSYPIPKAIVEEWEKVK